MPNFITKFRLYLPFQDGCILSPTPINFWQVKIPICLWFEHYALQDIYTYPFVLCDVFILLYVRMYFKQFILYNICWFQIKRLKLFSLTQCIIYSIGENLFFLLTKSLLILILVVVAFYLFFFLKFLPIHYFISKF